MGEEGGEGKMTTILGESIRLIRPQRIKVPRRTKNQNVEYDESPKAREMGAAEFFAMCLGIKTLGYFHRATPWERS